MEYRIDATGYESVHQESLVLSDIVYGNKTYRASIQGSLLYSSLSDETRTYTVSKQKISFSQIYGNTWKADVKVAEKSDKITIYARRAGKNVTGQGKTIVCDDRVVDAWKMESYTDINYIFYLNYNYLKFL